MLSNGDTLGHSNGAAHPIPVVKRKRGNPCLANERRRFATCAAAAAVPSDSSGSRRAGRLFGYQSLNQHPVPHRR